MMKKQTDSTKLTTTDKAKSVELKTNSQGTRLATQEYVDAAIQAVREQSNALYWHRDENTLPEIGDGYQKLPSGLILQWGKADLPPQGLWITFPIAFSDDTFRVFLTDYSGGGCHSGAALSQAGNFTGFRAYGRSIVNHDFANTGFAWFAIGG